MSESNYKKVECRRIDAFELWCWRRLLRVPWTPEIQPVNPKGNQSWRFIGRTDAEAETPILWPLDAKNWKSECETEVAQSCLTLCNPMDCSLLGFYVHGIFQARILDWVAISFSRRSSQSSDRTFISCIPGGFFTSELPEKPKRKLIMYLILALYLFIILFSSYYLLLSPDV